MNRFIAPLVLLAAAGSVSAGEASDRDKAMGAIDAFGTALKGELVGAMQDGGPLEAIGVCNTKAPGIAQAVSLEQGMQLSRVSLKNRNPGNAPNGWQEDVLLAFEERAATGENAGALTWQETAVTDGGMEYRFMKAIPTGGVCLACHGETLSPEVQAKIAELYPEDKATGYAEGDLRGAFVVVKRKP